MLSRYLQQHIQVTSRHAVNQLREYEILCYFEKLIAYGLRIPPFDKEAVVSQRKLTTNKGVEALARFSSYRAKLRTRMHMRDITMQQCIDFTTFEIRG